MALDPLVLSGIIGAGASLLGTGASVGTSANMNKKNRKWHEDQATTAYNRQLEMFDKQVAESERMYNQYQTPEALARQYQEAGLNRALAMSGGGAGSVQTVGQMGSAPQAGTPQTYMPDFSGVTHAGNQIMDGLFKQAQIEELKSQARKNNADANEKEMTLPYKIQSAQNNVALEKLGIESQELKNALQALDLSIQQSTAGYTIEQFRLEAETAKQNLANLKVAYDNALKEGQIKDEQVVLIQRQALNELKTGVLLEVQARAAEAGIKLTEAEIDNKLAQAGLFNSQSELYDAQVLTEFERTNGVKIDNEIKRKKSKYAGVRELAATIGDYVDIADTIVNDCVKVIAAVTPGGAALTQTTTTLKQKKNVYGDWEDDEKTVITNRSVERR